MYTCVVFSCYVIVCLLVVHRQLLLLFVILCLILYMFTSAPRCTTEVQAAQRPAEQLSTYTLHITLNAIYIYIYICI